MNIKVVTYLVYLGISIGLTVWVARTLHKSGRAFLVDAFHQNEALADSVNHLLVVGFYLINLGYVTLALKTEDPLGNAGESIEALSRKVGLVLLVLGGMHFFNLFVFNKLRTRSHVGMAPPPVEPNAFAYAAAPEASFAPVEPRAPGTPTRRKTS
ncbi:MAG TPA: hypothetical protein VGX28_01745 [Frankiaceae bacterium]|jgi:hypothetical protein|nr:hypothetical protein [Frankiaceae bacterium]